MMHHDRIGQAIQERFALSHHSKMALKSRVVQMAKQSGNYSLRASNSPGKRWQQEQDPLALGNHGKTACFAKFLSKALLLCSEPSAPLPSEITVIVKGVSVTRNIIPQLRLKRYSLQLLPPRTSWYPNLKPRSL